MGTRIPFSNFGGFGIYFEYEEEEFRVARKSILHFWGPKFMMVAPGLPPMVASQRRFPSNQVPGDISLSLGKPIEAMNICSI